MDRTTPRRGRASSCRWHRERHHPLWKIDLSFSSFESTALTADNAATNNMYKYCGMTDWEANVKKDILGKECYGFSIPAGGKSLDIYRVDGDTLKFGKGAKVGADVTEADRPTAIDDTRVFTRK